MTISEYETRFNELSCYGSGLIDTTLKKNEKFVQGLRSEFHDKMTVLLKGSFVDLVDMALRYENLMSKKLEATTTVSRGNSVNPNKRKFNPLWKRQAKGKKSGGSNNGPRKCYNCQQIGHLADQCSQGGSQQQQRQSGPGLAVVQRSLCFNCHQPGHMIKNCPLLQRTLQDKVFALEAGRQRSFGRYLTLRW